jgi:hypothetical protein
MRKIRAAQLCKKGYEDKLKSIIILNHFDLPNVTMYVPFLILVLRIILAIQGKKLNYGNLDA